MGRSFTFATLRFRMNSKTLVTQHGDEDRIGLEKMVRSTSTPGVSFFYLRKVELFYILIILSKV